MKPIKVCYGEPSEIAIKHQVLLFRRVCQTILGNGCLYFWDLRGVPIANVVWFHMLILVVRVFLVLRIEHLLEIVLVNFIELHIDI